MGCLLSCGCCPIDNIYAPAPAPDLDPDPDHVIIIQGNNDQPQVAVYHVNYFYDEPYKFIEHCTRCQQMFIKSVPNKCSHCGALSNNFDNILRPIYQTPEKQKLDHEIQTDVFGRKTQFAY